MLVVTLLLLSATALAAEIATGKINGTISDAETGEPVIGATLMLIGTTMGAKADLDGNFWVKHIPEGIYNLRISSVGYESTEIIDVKVVPDQPVDIDVSLKKVYLQTEGIKVTARAVHNTEASLLKQRQKSTTVSDAISSEDISRSGSGHAAEAMSKVTGASVVDGKFVYVRGLGDRYSTTHLNGRPLPSPDPDKQSVPMDLIPAGLLDNIVVEKTFTPDKPGNFAGGSTNLATKDYPDQRTLKFSVSTGFNSNTTLKDGLLVQNHSSTDWLGIDDGMRDLPQIVEDNPELQESSQDLRGRILGDTSSASYDSITTLANYIVNSSRAFTTEMQPHETKAPVNQSYALSFGNQYSLWDNPLGVLASLSYNRKYSSISDGITGLYEGADAVTQDNDMKYFVGTDEVLWGGLAELTYRPHENHKFKTTFMYTRHGETRNEYLVGRYPYHYNESQYDSLRYRWLEYSEQLLKSFQISGEHLGAPFMNDLLGQLRTNWELSISRTEQNEPDVRYFGDIKAYLSEDDYMYIINSTSTDSPSRSWRDLNESNDSYAVDFELPLSHTMKFKTGASYLEKNRTYRDRRFEYVRYNDYDGNIDTYTNTLGIESIDTTRSGRVYITLENYIEERTQDINQYDGYQKIAAGYGMIEAPVPYIKDLDFVGGVRYETTDMWGAVHDTTKNEGRIDDADWLPSLNLIYHLSNNANMRLSYGKTLARPTMRELTPSHTEEFGTGALFMGNDTLVHTRIDNYDARLEWFIRPGEVIAISGFYKAFSHPIVRAFVGNNGNIQVFNVDHGTVYGLEFEFRRHLDWIYSGLANFIFGGNLTLVSSKIDVAASEISGSAGSFNEHERPMPSQSPYVVNWDLGYDNLRTGTSASIYYNVFGRRLAVNSDPPTPDVYEEARTQLDLLFTQRLMSGTRLKLAAKNVLDEDVLFKYDGTRPDGSDAIYKRYSRGVTYSVGIAYDIW
ncbi:MAG TPA: TonB-dependent receptor [candidate division Zixibacteria bacterium]|nr:TonB-dependent receptor [candidate division Zixibacteria bacterium]